MMIILSLTTIILGIMVFLAFSLVLNSENGSVNTSPDYPTISVVVLFLLIIAAVLLPIVRFFRRN